MRLFAMGRRYRGETDVIVEIACRETVALAVRRDLDEHGNRDIMEQGRV